MAYGSELMFGLQQPSWKLLGLQLPTLEEGYVEPDYDKFEVAFKPFQKSLLKAHHYALLELGFTKSKKLRRSSYPCYKTPLGLRKFSPWRLELYYDTQELGEKPENATIAVAISGRYIPTFVDWQDECGTLWPVVFDSNMRKMMKIAKHFILKAVPFLQKAVWIVKEQHY